jgi:MerR family transcriptional regulator/heat shock protein HspR
MDERPNARRTEITLTVAAQRTGLSVRRIRAYMRRALVSQELTEAELARLRRIRRLSELGVNLAGIEVILRMRRQILELQEQLQRQSDPT